MTALRQWCLAHRLFVLALALGAAVRVVASLALSPGLVFSDGPLYLGFLRHFAAYPDHVAGYSLLLLYPLSLLTGSLILAATMAQSRHDPAAAAESWALSVAFLGKTIGT